MPQVAQGETIKNISKGIAITSLILVISIQFGILTAWLLPLPIIFYRIKLGRYMGSIVPVAAFLILWITLSKTTVGLLFFSELVLLGFVLSECIGLNLRVEKAILYTTGAVVGTGFLALFFYSASKNTTLAGLILDFFEEIRILFIQFYESMEQKKEVIKEASEWLKLLQQGILPILPALAVILTLLVVWLNLLVARPVLTNRGVYFPDYGSLNHWKAPDLLVWGAIACILLLFLPPETVRIAGLNGILIIMMVYFFQGIAIVSFFFEKKGFSRFLKIILYLFIAMQQIMLLFVISLGFFDTWLDFRKLEVAENNS